MFGVASSFPRVPTCLESLDPSLDGGFPPGSLILLLGETGAGDFEFGISSISNMLIAKKKEGFILPKKIIYITFTKSEQDILNEVKFSFPNYYKILIDNIQNKRLVFKDFSEEYFSKSFIPYSWMKTSEKTFSFELLKNNEKKANLIELVIEYLNKNADNNGVIIDSLTTFAQHCLMNMNWSDFIFFLHGLQRASKKWNCFVYALMTKEIFDSKKQEEVLECMDGAIFFEWENIGSSQRQRIMYIKKFRGLLPKLSKTNIVNFETRITPQKGFEVSNVKRVRGR